MSLLDFYGDDFADDLSEDDIRWGEDVGFDRLADVLRQALHEDYVDATDYEMGEALANVLDAMSPAESFNFAAALNQIGKGAGQVLSDPTFGSIARTVLPIAGGALGTVIGGPVGTALGSQLGNVAASALPPVRQAAPARPAAVPATGAPVAGAPVAAAPATAPVAPTGATASPVAGGSAAAAQGLVLAQQPQILQGLLATALGQHGRQQIGGVPVAQLLGMLSQVLGQAAADADELMYLEQRGDDSEGVLDSWSGEADRSLYTGLIDADNMDLADAIGYDGFDR